MAEYSLLHFASKQTQLFELLSVVRERLNIHLTLFQPASTQRQRSYTIQDGR